MKTVGCALAVASRFCYSGRYRRDQLSTVQPTDRQSRWVTQVGTAGVVVAERHKAECLVRNDVASLDYAEAESISTLLDDECFLRKILSALVEDGLQECRLVCRKWRDLCDALPVKLVVLSRSDVQNVPNTFPQAAALSLHSYSSDRSTDDTRSRRSRPVSDWFDSLTKLPSLKSLTVEVMYASDIKLCETGSPFFPLVQLQFLAITTIGDLNANNLFLGVRVLTNLTSLRLIAKSVWITPSTAKPVFEIERLKELEISGNLFSNCSGQLMFPCLAHLKHFGLADQPRLLAQVYEFCGTSLQSLRIGSCDDYGSTVVDWSVLLQFSKLESLAFDNLSNCTGVVERVVGNMIFLTSLRFNGASHDERTTTDMLASLGGLRSLCYLPRDGSRASNADADVLNISHLTHLTGLTTILYNKRLPFRNLTNLIAVDVLVSVKLDLSGTISRLTLLETLKVVNRQKPCLRAPSVLRKLKLLKSATLEMPNDISGDFFPALASLSALTFLQFNCRNHVESVQFLNGISLVTNLKKLSVEHVVVAHPLGFLQHGSLHRLRSLRIQPFPDLEETREELRRRFPCLGRITP